MWLARYSPTWLAVGKPAITLASRSFQRPWRCQFRCDASCTMHSSARPVRPMKMTATRLMAQAAGAGRVAWATAAATPAAMNMRHVTQQRSAWSGAGRSWPPR